MSTFQFAALAVCVGLNMLDGFDVLVMSFTASGVSAEWKLSGGQLGLLLSAGLAGMAAGSEGCTGTISTGAPRASSPAWSPAPIQR